MEEVYVGRVREPDAGGGAEPGARKLGAAVADDGARRRADQLHIHELTANGEGDGERAVSFAAVADAKDAQGVVVLRKANAVVADAEAELRRVDVFEALDIAGAGFGEALDGEGEGWGDGPRLHWGEILLERAGEVSESRSV
jgi:hypothetical protein